MFCFLKVRLRGGRLRQGYLAATVGRSQGPRSPAWRGHVWWHVCPPCLRCRPSSRVPVGRSVSSHVLPSVAAAVRQGVQASCVSSPGALSEVCREPLLSGLALEKHSFLFRDVISPVSGILCARFFPGSAFHVCDFFWCTVGDSAMPCRMTSSLG